MKYLAQILGKCEDLGLICSPPSDASLVEIVLRTVFMIGGAVAVIMLIVGGAKYMTSIGDPAKIKSAKDTVMYAIIGLAVVIFAQLILSFILGSIGKV